MKYKYTFNFFAVLTGSLGQRAVHPVWTTAFDPAKPRETFLGHEPWIKFLPKNGNRYTKGESKKVLKALIRDRMKSKQDQGYNIVATVTEIEYDCTDIVVVEYSVPDITPEEKAEKARQDWINFMGSR